LPRRHEEKLPTEGTEDSENSIIINHRYLWHKLAGIFRIGLTGSLPKACWDRLWLCGSLKTGDNSEDLINAHGGWPIKQISEKENNDVGT